MQCIGFRIHNSYLMDTTMGYLLLVYELVTVIHQLTPIVLFGTFVQSILPLKELFILTMYQMLIITFGS